MDDEDDDIFQMLLTQRCNRNLEGRTVTINDNETSNVINIDDDDEDDDMDNDEVDSGKEFSFDLKFSIDSTITQPPTKPSSDTMMLEFIYKQGWSVLGNSRDKQFLYVLVDSYGMVIVHLYPLDCNDKSQDPRIAASIPTSLKSSLFRESRTAQSSTSIKHLYIVHQTDENSRLEASHSSNLQSSNMIQIPVSSFASIFGKTTALVKSAVLLLCTVDGCVYWKPVKSLGQEGGSRLVCQLHCAVKCVVGVLVKRQSGMDKDVMTALREVLEPKSDDFMTGLLAVSQMGECCLLLPNPSRSHDWYPIRFCLPHSVICCVANRYQLIYSTGWSVEKVTLVIKENKEVNGQPSISLEDCISLCIGQIKHLDLKTADDDTEDLQVFGVTSDLDVILIPSSSDKRQSVSTTHHQLPDTLGHIKRNASTIQQLQAKSDELDSQLLQLNFFAHLNQQQNLKKMSQEAKLIHCNCFVDHSQGHKKVSEIRICLRNDSSIKLSDKWSVVVTAIPQVCMTETKIHTNSVCFKMGGGFRHGSEKTFSIPLPKCMNSDPLAKLQIDVSLALLVTQEFGPDETCTTASDVDNRNRLLIVNIHEETFDILHFIQVVGDHDLSGNICTDYSKREFRKMVNSYMERKTRRRRGDCLDDGRLESRKDVLTVKLKIPNMMTTKDIKIDIREEVVECLHHKLQHFDKDEGDGPLLCQGLDGTEIRLAMETTESSSGHGSPSYLLRLECADIVLLGAVHLALWDKFQELTKTSRLDHETGMPSKQELVDQLTALKTQRQTISTIKDGMITTLCQTMDFLGTCGVR